MSAPAQLRIARSEPEECVVVPEAEFKAMKERLRRMEEALENIRQRTVDDTHALPIARSVPNGCFMGSMLFIEGLCQAALDS